MCIKCDCKDYQAIVSLAEAAKRLEIAFVGVPSNKLIVKQENGVFWQTHVRIKEQASLIKKT